MGDKAWILGCRGSVSVSGEDKAVYGGATTCVLLRMGGQYVVLDAGSGLLNLPAEALSQAELPVLLSHFHLDHLSGLPLCPYLFQRGAKLTIYAGCRAGLDAAGVLERLYNPPFWPVPLRALPGRVVFQPLAESFSVGALRVDTLEGDHPGGVTVFRVTGGGKRVVFATDCTLSPPYLPALAAFAQGCDLLLCDGQYSREEWPGRSDFGHNTWEAAARFAEACGARRFRVIHHDPFRSDDALTAAGEEVRGICPCGGMARQGEEIAL